MAALSQLEKSLNEIFVGSAPKLPKSVINFLVKYLPYINLVLGILTLWSAWVIYRWATVAHELTDYLNSYSQAVGGAAVTRELTIMLWLGIIVLIAMGALYLAAFPGTRDRKKSGWNLLFCALLINVVYGVIIAFTSYGGFGNLFGSLLGSAIGLYFLFQIRSSYS